MESALMQEVNENWNLYFTTEIEFCLLSIAAAAAGTIFILSMISTTSLEDVAAAAPDGIKWLQLFISKDRQVTINLVRKAERAGFKALVLTVDCPVDGDQRANRRNNFNLPPHLKFVEFLLSLIS